MAILVLVVLFWIVVAWFLFEAIWPSRASWRSVCDAGYWHTQYVPVTTCTNGNCSTRTESHSDYVCTRSHWTCVKGRDGSTRCADPRPGTDY
ncbi:hypothetical protein AEYBE204_13100 [Asticcacaulis sp. YBE204]|nr:hypothetical protein AEYBE204_13100 [Asticcacaulis sp. YBE204]